jgi:hypothetical protein
VLRHRDESLAALLGRSISPPKTLRISACSFPTVTERSLS